jgi:hypothetical protein
MTKSDPVLPVLDRPQPGIAWRCSDYKRQLVRIDKISSKAPPFG